MHELSQGWHLLSVLANLGIVFGYVLVPFTVLRYLPLTRNVMVAGTLFFVTCAITHLSMAFDVVELRALVINHVVQALAAIWFVFGFFRLLRQANVLREVSPDQQAKPIDSDGLT